MLDCKINWVNKIFTRIIKKVFEPVADTVKNTYEKLTISNTESSIKNNKALENLNNKIFEKMNDRGILASYLRSPLSKITNPENSTQSTQFKLVKGSSSTRVNDLLKKNTKPITLHDNLLTFGDCGKVFELKDLLKTISNKNYNGDLASLADEKLMYDFAKEMHFYAKGQGRKSTRDRTLINLLKLPAIVASGISNTIFLSSNPDELCDRMKLLLKGKHAGNSSDLFNREIVAIVDKLLEYKCLSKNQHKQILNKCNLFHM